MSDEIIEEIDRILGLEYEYIPEGAVDAYSYAENKPITPNTASAKLRQAYLEGKLERAKGRNGRLYYWPKTV